MKRRILLLLSLFIAILAKADITVGENQMWWGYFHESNADNLPYTGYLGYGSSCTFDVAIRIPASEQIVSSSTIKGIRFWLGTDISAISSSVRVWISTKKPTAATTSATRRQTILKSKLVGGLNEVELSNPFEVNGQDIWVGYTFTISQKAYPIMAYGDDVQDGLYCRVNNGNWDNLYGYGYGHLALQILIESENFPTNCVNVSDFGRVMVLNGKNVSIPVTFSNKGINPVTSLSYVVTSDDGTTGSEVTKNLASSPMTANAIKTYNISFAADEQPRKSQKTVTVTKVNGEPNTSTMSSGTGFVITLLEKEKVTPVIEEFTGTWCGWCPRGMTGMELIHRDYGDKIVQIAVHGSDVMTISAYSSVLNKYCNGYPGSITDRQYDEDPSYASLKNVVATALKRVAQGHISLSAMWSSSDKKAVVFNTKTCFGYSDNNGKYAIAYVLTEDGLKGTGSDWAQANYYNGQSGDANMSFWYTAGSPVSGLEFNHVAVAGWSVENGVNGSVNPVLEAGVDQEYSYTGTIPSNAPIQDKSRLKAIVMLIDRETGTIVNAAQAEIQEYGTAVSTVMSDGSNEPSAVYSVDGRRIQTAEKGINIIRMADGTVKKVLVK